MLIGILSGLAAGALWGLTFVAPRAVAPYSEIDLAILRYLSFGVISLGLMAVSSRFRPGRLTPQRMLIALWLGLSGFVIYYVCIAISVSLAGPAIAPLVIGGLPLMLAIYGNWQDRNVTWGAIAGPLGLIAAGLAVVNIATVQGAGSATARSNVIWGFLVAVVGLIVWFLYAITNAKIMRGDNPPPALGWTGLQGLGAAAGVLPLIAIAPMMGWSRVPDLGFAGDAGMRFIVWALVTGVFASWVAQYLWTLASHRLPLALSAQLIVSETIFALIYGFIYEHRWPHLAEWAAGVLLIIGVFWGTRVFAVKPH